MTTKDNSVMFAGSSECSVEALVDGKRHDFRIWLVMCGHCESNTCIQQFPSHVRLSFFDGALKNSFFLKALKQLSVLLV